MTRLQFIMSLIAAPLAAVFGVKAVEAAAQGNAAENTEFLRQSILKHGITRNDARRAMKAREAETEYALHRINELTGIDFTNPEELKKLQVAYHNEMAMRIANEGVQVTT